MNLWLSRIYVELTVIQNQVALSSGDVVIQDAAGTDEAAKEMEVQPTGNEMIIVPCISGNPEVIEDNTADVADTDNTTESVSTFLLSASEASLRQVLGCSHYER